jgi:hypothetical protein
VILIFKRGQVRKAMKGSSMKKVEEKALIFSTFTSVLLSFAVVIGAVALITLRTKQNRDYDEKWKDYDECGV